MEEIIIKALKIFAYHGVNPEETQNGQEFELDITVFADLSAARKSDNLDDTVNYAKLRKVINAAMCDKPYKLIERAADEVAERIIREFPKIKRAEVLLKKPNAPMSGVFDYVAVKVIKEANN